MSAADDLAALPPLHAQTLQTLLATLQADPRLEAALGGGSLAHGTLDAHSDLDLVVVVRDADYPAVMTERRAIAGRAGPLLSAFTGEHVGEPRLLICLYGPPLLHVDLKFVTAPMLDALVETPAVLWARDPAALAATLRAARVHWPERDPQWFEDRVWIWLHYGASKLHRGELFEALGMLAHLREQVLGPLLRRHAGERQRGVRHLDFVPALREALLPTVAAYDAATVRAALAACAALYLRLRADAPPPQAIAGMPDTLLDFLDAPGTGDG
ncbi:hypothetical protein [Solimonas variicoloris]|uniref:hypothetical protein n=1 Tax=Solimonas variicoloris TaxID=254408 RepID=UPI000381C6F5|nr:hypothetical protein [Solimonas variicoloris]